MHTGTLASYKYIFAPGHTATNLTLLLLHGTGGDERSLLNFATRIAPTTHHLSPCGTVREGTYNRFFARLTEGVFDATEVTARAHELANFITAATTTHNLQDTKVVALGFSNGANIAAAVLQTTPAVLSGAILLRAMPVLSLENPPPLARTPILLLSGADDELIPVEHAGLLAHQLTNAGAQLTHRVHPATHALETYDLTTAHNWLIDNF